MDDLEPKTLDQLSLESKEKKYVTVDDASKISGYTKDYLERLCRLYKIDYRTIKNSPEKFVLELESLLRETHTLLISRDGIVFVDKNELAPEIPKPVAPPPPPPAPAPVLPPKVESSAPSYVSPLVPEMVIPSFIPPAPRPLPRPSVVGVVAVPELPPATLTPPPPANIPHKPVTPALVEEQKPEPKVEIEPVVNGEPERPPMRPLDEWDAQLFGGVESASSALPRKFEAPQPALYETPSPYRPIHTSVNARAHEDNSALFPVIGEVQEKKGDVPIHVKSPAPTPLSSTIILQPLVRESVTPQPMRAVVEERTPEPIHVAISHIETPKPTVALPQQTKEVTPPIQQSRVTPSAPVAAPTQSYVSHAAMRAPAVGRIVLPEVQPEHHLTKPEPHALSKSVIFNTIFALTLISSSLLYISNAFPEQLKGLLTGTSSVYVASPLPAMVNSNTTNN